MLPVCFLTDQKNTGNGKFQIIYLWNHDLNY